ncbi:hypothetical protein D3C75_1250910 [compost metagenome]
MPILMAELQNTKRFNRIWSEEYLSLFNTILLLLAIGVFSQNNVISNVLMRIILSLRIFDFTSLFLEAIFKNSLIFTYHTCY